jgi:hypothetical protein
MGTSSRGCHSAADSAQLRRLAWADLSRRQRAVSTLTCSHHKSYLSRLPPTPSFTFFRAKSARCLADQAAVDELRLVPLFLAQLLRHRRSSSSQGRTPRMLPRLSKPVRRRKVRRQARPRVPDSLGRWPAPQRKSVSFFAADTLAYRFERG